ncbi:hypothetical protein D9758_013719 [Tetrapyrgos nigripes]|uniref:Uncharacterized protein n=1 Tax=Tetrapyrgos nigripes TaxID=182062 RepID=A0A8H5G1T6_9AGAR|nr:hypothetical protein D9758_013719 [Tetrapyrgos nigripes]
MKFRNSPTSFPLRGHRWNVPQTLHHAIRHQNLPPTGNFTVYIFSDPVVLSPSPDVHVTLRLHDECNRSDVWK